MKSAYYTAIVTNAYRQAIDAAAACEALDPAWVAETDTVSHRPYSTGFYFGDPGQYYPDSMYDSTAEVMAVVQSCNGEGDAILTQRNKFYKGDSLELVRPGEKPVSFVAQQMFDADGMEIEDTRRAMMEIHMKLPCAAPPFSIVRKRK